MGGGSRPGPNFKVRARADGRREFFQHDDREYDKQSSSSSFSNRSSTYSYGRGAGARSWQNAEGGYGRGGHRGYRGKYARNYVNNDDGASTEGKGRHQEFYENSRRIRRGKKELYRGRSDGYRGRTDGYRGAADGYKTKTAISYRTLWHKIIIYDTCIDQKDEVLDILKGNVDEVFSPVLFKEEGRNLVFYLEKQPHVAKAILTLSNRISLGNDRKLLIKCLEVSPPPSKKLTDEQNQIVTTVMSNRYSVEMRRLDLRNFHNDPTLIREQIFCPLYRHIGLTAVLDIIIAHIPTVEEIDFSNNQLTTLADLEMLRDCENLKRLTFDHNKLKFVDGTKLKEIPIEEISFSGNPLRDKYPDSKSYRTVLTKEFPKVRILDGVEVERPIGFVVETEVLRVPKSKPSFFCSDEAKGIVLTFIEQYYQVYESESRQALDAAYTEDALFSLTSSFPSSGHGSKFTQTFLRENRNLLAISNEKKHRLLAKGRTDVIEAICRLPVVSHDPNSFIVDIPIVQPRLIHVVLMGVFKQIIDSQSPIRSFIRSLIIVPVGQGFCISNEELFINPATYQQISKAFKAANQTETAALESGMPSGQAPAIAVETNLEPAQLALMQQFAGTSKMLPEYCKLCLEQNNWDYNKAGEMFVNLQKENKIPPEYFGLSV